MGVEGRLNEQVIDIQVGKRSLHLSTHMVKSAERLTFGYPFIK